MRGHYYLTRAKRIELGIRFNYYFRKFIKVITSIITEVSVNI